ncbi:MAG TPA: DUF433 domain-containing protein [Isosphaeraceae bacterium]|nr:DUF433 domain-containing protein [Isosphaeraceae bacterium]
MATNLIHDRGRGPELVGTRITVYNLLPDFLDPTVTEADICRRYELTPEQVAACRAYVFNNPDTVLAKHLELEARMAAGNPPQLIEQAKRTHATLLRFKEWLVQRQDAAAQEHHSEVTSESGRNGSQGFPTFEEWRAEQESRPQRGS